MRIKINSLLVKKDADFVMKVGNESAFRVKDIIFNADPNTLKRSNEDGEILKCLKSCIQENKNTIDYLETSKLIDISNIIGNNFWNDDEFLRVCKFEFRDYFDLRNCKIIYV